MNQVLFICTGNYYRSRFAEILFNHLAAQNQLDWQAFSRGFRPGPHNIGPISPFTLQKLDSMGIPPGELNNPVKITQADLEKAQLSIALKEVEHRPYAQQDFPEWENKITYWHVHDVDQATPQEALPQIENLVRNLLEELKG